MRIVIVDGGEIGFSLANGLAVDHDVNVVDQSNDVAARFESPDVQFVLGNGTSGDALDRAGIEKAHVIAACTALDEVNILWCAVARQQAPRARSVSSPVRTSSISKATAI
jgi:trk system potassium uptake protein